MTGLYSGEPQDNAALRELGTDALPAGAGEVLGAELGEGFAPAFPTSRLVAAETEFGIPTDEGEAFGQAFAQGTPAPTPMLSADAANAKYGIPGYLSFSAPIPEAAAADIQQRKREELARQDIIERGEGFLTKMPVRLAIGLLGGLPGIVDPLNLAASFIPGVPEAALAARLGSGLMSRLATGAAAGAIGQAGLLPVPWALSKQDHEDFSAADALWSVALGGLFGGGLHVAAGLARDPLAEAGRAPLAALARAEPETREALLRGAVARVAEDEPANVAPIAGIIEEASPTSPYERVPKPPTRLAEFLRQEGGIADEGGELAAILGGQRRPGLANRGGLDLDEAARRAWEAGYLPEAQGERPEISTLLSALGEDLGGKPRYGEADFEQRMLYEDALARNDEIARLSARHQIPAAGKTQAQFYDAVAERLSQDDTAREYESQDQAAEAAHAQAQARLAELTPAEDLYEGGSPRSIEELEDELRQEESARPAAGGLVGAGAPGSARRAAGALQDVARSYEPRVGAGSGAAAAAGDAGLTLEEEIAAIEREIGQARAAGIAETPEDQAEHEAADAEAGMHAEFARAAMNAAACLARRL